VGGADDEPRPCRESAFIVVPHPEFSRQGWPSGLGGLRVVNISFFPVVREKKKKSVDWVSRASAVFGF
jgi:hypothetical protein